jgi:two-component sensor histidine kinase
VQSLANQTARGAANTHEFRERFEGRLIALSKAHDQLTDRNWQNADLRAILSASIAPYLSGSSEQTALRGEDVTLKPRAALTLAMVFHELTTNAAKYGALSVPNGCLRISWERQLVPKPLLRITWQEEKGPAVVTPARRGFGTYFIEGSVASELGGKAGIAYEKAGLRCVMDIPLASAQPDAPAKAEAHASLVWEDRSPGLTRGRE